VGPLPKGLFMGLFLNDSYAYCPCTPRVEARARETKAQTFHLEVRAPLLEILIIVSNLNEFIIVIITRVP
jgi:hypothetical protein